MDKRWVRWVLAFGFWTAVVLFYSTRTGRLGQELDFAVSLKRAMAQWYVWALLTPFIIAIDRRLPVTREALGRRLLFHIPLSVVFTYAYLYLSAWGRSLLLVGREPFAWNFDILLASWGGAFHWGVLIYWVIVGAYGAYDYYSEYKERQLKAARLERLLAESRLDALRTQLHPHFLFNALNAISAHVESDPRTARRMLEQLGELLRLSLDHAEDQEIPLEQEIAFLERYLAIQKVRFEDRLDVAWNVNPEVLHTLVPTFVLQPLVENAIRHGVSSRTDKGSIEVAAWRDNGRVHLRVSDDGPGLPAGWTQGVGLSNTIERLRSLYPENEHSFDITGKAGEGTRVDLSIPLREVR